MTHSKLGLFDIRQCYAGKALPDEQLKLFQNSHQAFPSRPISASSCPSPLEHGPFNAAEFEFISQNQRYDLADYISRNRISAMLLMKNDKILFENYQQGNNQSNHWLSMSMAKSIASTLVGVAIHDGHIEHLDDLLVNYLPELNNGAYADVSVRQLLLMSSGAEWDEDQTNKDSHRRAVLDLQIAQQANSITHYMS
jgi:CubicO group peptidase (beta-lactamase class C family)